MSDQLDDPDELPEARYFGTTPGGGWTPETWAYKRNPTAACYLKLRRANPEAEIEVKTNGGVDQLYDHERELKKCGIEPRRFSSVLDADQETISFYALFFLEKLEEARQRKAQGETHLVRRGLAVPDKLIDWFIKCALDAMSYYGALEINRDLIVLIKERLGGQISEYEQITLTKEQKLWACWAAGAMKARGEEPSIREVARRLGLSPSTVSRWFAPGEFKAAAEKWAAHFTPEGEIKPPFDDIGNGEF